MHPERASLDAKQLEGEGIREGAIPVSLLGQYTEPAGGFGPSELVNATAFIVTDSSRQSDVRMIATVLVRVLKPVLQARRLAAPGRRRYV
jgi:hypothetical protein